MEELAKNITLYISHAAEIVAALIIGISIIKAIIAYTAFSIKKELKFSKEEIRLRFGSSVAIALELLLGADVLATAVAPSWNDIGHLAAIACIRTALNYFLEKELRHTKVVSNVKQ
jgi:uncharacterized membrane protein